MEVWSETRSFFAARDPREVERAERDPKHKMALVFRWYIGLGSHWAIEGVPGRKTDYQIWCGPAMAAFNAWVRGSFLADLPNRSVVQIALNVLEGAAVIARAQQLHRPRRPRRGIRLRSAPARLLTRDHATATVRSQHSLSPMFPLSSRDHRKGR